MVITVLELLVAWTAVGALVGVALGHAIGRRNAESPDPSVCERAA